MPDYNWSGWQKTAIAASGGPTLPVDTGYVGEIIDAGAKPTQKGTPQLWWSIKVIVGPQAGTVERMTQTLNPENPKALAAFYGVCDRIGISFDGVPDGTPPEAIAKLAIGRKLKFDFEHRVDPQTNRKYPDFKRLELVEGAAPAATVAAPAAAVAAPATVAPAQDAVAVAPVGAAAPAELSIEDQIAALLAKQAATEAVPAEAPKGKLPF